MPILKVTKSKGKTVYLSGLRVFINTTGIITLSYKTDFSAGITYIKNDTNAHKFFKKLLEIDFK